MPNYGLVINSRFRPFSYAEMLAPVQQQTEAHQALEEAYGALGAQAGTIESMLNRELDRDAYNQYQGYMKGLQEQADILAKEGLSPSVRNSLMNMRQRYGQEIIPIQKAAERREKLAEEQRKLGNNYIFDFDASNTSLSEFMNNPTLNYRGIDRIELLKEAQNQFSQFQNELRDFKIDPSRRLDKFHKTLIESYGFSPQQAAEYARQVASGQMDDSTAVGIVANNVYNATGVAGWNNAAASQRVWQTIAEGLPATVGKTDASVLNDEQASINARAASELNLYKEKVRLAREAEEQANQDAMIRAWDPNVGYLFQSTGAGNNPSSTYQQVMLMNPQLSQAFREQGLLDENGNITSKGIAVLNTPKPERTAVNENTQLRYVGDNSDSRDMKEAVRLGTENRFREIFVREDRIPNIEGTAVSRLNITGEDRDNIERAIKSAIGSDGRIYAVGNLDSEHHLITEGSSITASEFDRMIKDGTRIKYIGNNAYTDQIFFQMDNGQWYHMPSPVYSAQALDVISQNNRLLQQTHLTPQQEALYGNNIMTQLGQPLNHDVGTPMKKNDGTITFYPE